MAESDDLQTTLSPDLAGLAWQLGHSTSRDGGWIRTVLAGYLHARGEALGKGAANEAALDALRLASSLRGTLEAVTEILVREARDTDASWAKVGEATGVSKQTAYSRWGGPTPLESRSDGTLVLADLERDTDHRFIPITADTSRTETEAAVPTPEQRAVVAERFVGAPVSESETDMDLVAIAVTTMARGLAAQSGADWSSEWRHYLELALRVAAPNSLKTPTAPQ